MITTNFTPFPVLTTERLVLRSLEISDDAAIFAHRCDDRVNTYLEDWRHQDITQTRAFIIRVQQEIEQGRTILWVLSRKDNPAFMGTVCLWNISEADATAETGYTMDPAFHKMGYMQEALEATIDFGFRVMQLKMMNAYTHERNNSSIRLLQRNGFIQGTPKKPVSGNRVYFELFKERQ